MSPQGRVNFENRLWKLQGGRCSICNEPLLRDERFHDGAGWNLDHVYPRSRYGRLGNCGNVLLSHMACNTAKSDREPTGCEVLLLYAVNAMLGHRLVDPAKREWRCAETGPTAIQVAWQRLVERQAKEARVIATVA